MNNYLRLKQHARLIVAVASLIPISMGAGAQKNFPPPPPIPGERGGPGGAPPPHPDPKLPNVLLLGDSLSRNYFPEVTKDLAGTANVYLMASSTSVGDPRLP